MIRSVKYSLLLIVTLAFAQRAEAQRDAITLKHTDDFSITGKGDHALWKKASWNTLTQREGEKDTRASKFKALYSDTGLYFLFLSEDEILTAYKTSDFDSLWKEDVVEVFLWPDTMHTIYFEYELSPLNYELPILVPNINGRFLGWRPWIYSEGYRTKHLTSVTGGEKKSGSRISEWYAEFFIPYKLLTPLANVPPHSGTVWRANMYRVDYDHKKTIEWSWQETKTNFHEFRSFGKLVFE